MHETYQDGNEKGIKINGWVISTVKAPILNSMELQRITERFEKINFPDMFFGNNYLTVKHEPSETVVSFNAVDALARVDVSPKAGSLVQVSYARQWAAKSLGDKSEKMKNVVKPYDWTFTTDYKGTTPAENNSGKAFAPTAESIDIERLKRPDPILFYDEVVLYEDELADNGSCVVNVRVRVMPSCFLVLHRCFLRVDDVLFRVNDTRLYHEFGSTHLIREYTSRELDFETVKGKLPKAAPWAPPGTREDLTLLTDSNWVSNVLSSDLVSQPSKHEKEAIELQ
ncbi:hypothetical protein HDU96_010041 [Phlyctochytrium bullatum]|nr:hypothetical protein HDU96_010041 [Phlyctochytrium bullatum]